MKTPQLYGYKAHVIDVYDGDTITVNIDLGLGISAMSQKIRLFGIDTPELRGRSAKPLRAKAAKSFLLDLVLFRDVVLKTHKTKKGREKKTFERWLADVYIDGLWVNEAIVENKYGVWRKY